MDPDRLLSKLFLAQVVQVPWQRALVDIPRLRRGVEPVIALHLLQSDGLVSLARAIIDRLLTTVLAVNVVLVCAGVLCRGLRCDAHRPADAHLALGNNPIELGLVRLVDQ